MRMFQGLRTVIYHVDNLEDAKAWYAKALGVEPYFDQPFYVGFNIGGFELGLDPDMSGVSKGNNAVAYWGVKDAASSYERVNEANIFEFFVRIHLLLVGVFDVEVGDVIREDSDFVSVNLVFKFERKVLRRNMFNQLRDESSRARRRV